MRQKAPLGVRKGIYSGEARAGRPAPLDPGVQRGVQTGSNLLTH